MDRHEQIASVDPDDTPLNVALNRIYTVCHSSSTILDTTSGSKLYLFKFYNKYGKELRCPNA